MKLIENQSIENLTPYMDAPESVIKKEDYFEGLWGATVRDGQTFGVPVDCNPMVLWYNKKVLKEAGITEMPADLQANGQWTWDKFKEMSDKIRDSKSTATCWITPGTAITAGLLPTAAEYTTTKGTS